MESVDRIRRSVLVVVLNPGIVDGRVSVLANGSEGV